ncbi:hypothetical protein B0H13DRAFT_1591859 [Mycena leptocephala]|nr:hypothetical protein B0H13DRAFT_1591859 [Mycena leptocephala]
MPPSIDSWAKALSDVKRSSPPACGTQIQNCYVFPEPALLVSAADERRRQMILHHYQLMRDALLYRLGDASDSHLPLTMQQWRDILQGKVAKQGKTGTRAEARSASIEAVLAPAMQACDIDQYRDFPVDPGDAPRTTQTRAREIVWEVAEVNFRFELLALDARASGLDRPNECKQCFPGNVLLGFDISESKLGFAAKNARDRLPYVLHLASLMLDWKLRPRAGEIESAFQQQAPEWNITEIDALEQAVAGYYTQSFYDIFGRAAVVPMRLAHEFGT